MILQQFIYKIGVGSTKVEKVLNCKMTDYTEFYIQNIVDNVHHLAESGGDVGKLYPYGLRLPYEKCVFTFTHADITFILFCEEQKIEYDTWKFWKQRGPQGLLVYYQMLISEKDGRVKWVGWNHAIAFELTKDYGATSFWGPIAFKGSKESVESVRQFPTAELAEDISWQRMILFTTLTLINCVNIKKERVLPTRDMIKKARKHHSCPPLEYRVVKIPQFLYPRPGESLGEYHNRLHTCRGHFKRCTNLFGRAIEGIFWWRPHVRGSRTLGEIKKGYEVVR